MSVFGQALHFHQHADSYTGCHHHSAPAQHCQSHLACQDENPFERHRQRSAADLAVQGDLAVEQSRSTAGLARDLQQDCHEHDSQNHDGDHDGAHCGICLILGQCAPAVAVINWCESSGCVAIVSVGDDSPIQVACPSAVARGPPTARTRFLPG